MTRLLPYYLRFALLLLFAALVLGVISSWAFLFPEQSNTTLPFYQLRPMHVSAALFWILTGATACICAFRENALQLTNREDRPLQIFMILWMATIVVIFGFYSMKQFGGREYWVFPPFLCLPLLAAWVALMISWYRSWWQSKEKTPLYILMWFTGILFFLITFLEQNLWQIPWFRDSFLRDITVQWKSNGSMVGAWNQMIYGSSLFIMVKISGDKTMAAGKKVFFFYFLGLTNLMFNWGHHFYNLPGAGWVRHVSYFISMTEWLIFLDILRGFRKKLKTERKLKHLLSFRFINASEYWVFANLVLALFMSIPAVNRYTHGTHITVAHAMGTTIGINTMILLAAFMYFLRMDRQRMAFIKNIKAGYALTQISLALFWLSLITAGVIKGYGMTRSNPGTFQEIMQPAMPVLYVFAIAGVFLAIGICLIIWPCWLVLGKGATNKQMATSQEPNLYLYSITSKKETL